MGIKCLILFSGGIDSILAVKILEKQIDADANKKQCCDCSKINRINTCCCDNVKLLGITFKSCFFNEKQAKKYAKEIKLRLRVIDFSKEHLELVKKPKYGYGKAMNPCIDCHMLMLKKAKEIMEKEKFNFIATGEVLGERPMSQNKQALNLIEKESLLTGYLLRPLSAKLLNSTISENSGLINRKKLLDISGRSRKRQIALAKKYKIKKYPNPAGGCLLTDQIFGKRLKELFQIYPKCDSNDVELLKYGRHFLEDKVKIIVGRNEDENNRIKKLVEKGDILIDMKNYTGPITLIRNYKKLKIKNSILEKAKTLTQYYSIKARNKKDIKFRVVIK